MQRKNYFKKNALDEEKKLHHIKWENKKVIFFTKNENEKYEESLMLRTTRVERFLTIYVSENHFGSYSLFIHRDLMPFLSLSFCVFVSFCHCSRFCFLGKMQTQKSHI